jgi:hypothetical protein
MTSLSTPAVPPALATFLRGLRATKPERVLCLPCSAGNETFAAVALHPAHPPQWFHMTCMALLSDGTRNDIAQTLRQFTRLFDVLYTEFDATDVGELPGIQTIRASMGHDTTASTSDVYLLADGTMLCFAHREHTPACELIVLQRLAFAGAQTFDVLLVPPSRDRNHARELRLIDKTHLQVVTEWGNQSGAVVMRSPGEPIPLSLILRLFQDGCPADQMEQVFSGHTSDNSDDSEASDDEEWVAPETSDESNESESMSDDEDWHAELDNLR